MAPVFDFDDAAVRPLGEPLSREPSTASPVPVEPVLVPSEDQRAIALLDEWRAVAPMPEIELERHLADLGRTLPDHMEMEILARRLHEYEPSPNSFRALDGFLASLMLRRTEQPVTEQDVAVAKGIFCLISEPVYDRWKFASREQMLVRVVFFYCDPFTRRLLVRLENWLKEGFDTQQAVQQARAYVPVLEILQTAYPDLADRITEFTASLDMAEYSFAHSAGAPGDLVHEGVSSMSSRDVTVATSMARSRLLTSSLPPMVQENLTQFLKLAEVIDLIDVMIKRESLKHKAATESHALYPSLMELEFRALTIINDLKIYLVKREHIFDEMPSIIRSRNVDAAHLFERVRAHADTISEAVLDSRERQISASRSTDEILTLRAEIDQNAAELQDLRKQLSERVVMDALVASAGILASQDPRFEIVSRKGPVRLRVVEGGGVEYAVVFVHGLDAKWSLMSGTRLEMQGVHGVPPQTVDLVALRELVRNTHPFGDAREVRLRIVLEAGDLVGGRTNYVFTRNDVVGDPARLLEASDFDTI